MDIEKLIQEQNLWMSDGFDFAILTAFSAFQNGKLYTINCVLQYDLEEKTWSYEFNDEPMFEEEIFQNAKEKALFFLEKHTKEKRKNIEERVEELFAGLVFSHDYYWEKSTYSIHGSSELLFSSAKIAGEEIDMRIYLREKDFSSLQIVFLEYDDESVPTLKIKWDTAKKCIKGMQEFETFFYTKSKDRLTLLF